MISRTTENPLRGHGVPVLVGHRCGRFCRRIGLRVLAQGVDVGAAQQHLAPSVVHDPLVLHVQRTQLDQRARGVRRIRSGQDSAPSSESPEHAPSTMAIASTMAAGTAGRRDTIDMPVSLPDRSPAPATITPTPSRTADRRVGVARSVHFASSRNKWLRMGSQSGTLNVQPRVA